MTDASALLAELVALAPPVRQAGDIDARMYAESLANGMTERYAGMLLDKMVKQGILTRHDVYDPDRKRQVRIWRKVVVS